MYTANLYFVFNRKDGNIGHRLITSTEILAKNINLAKSHATRICKNSEKLKDWDLNAKWSPLIEEEIKRDGNIKKFYQKTFINPPDTAEPTIFMAFVDLVIE